MGKHSEITRAPSRLVSRSLVKARGEASASTAPKASPLAAISSPVTLRPVRSIRLGSRGTPLFMGAFAITLGVLLVNVVDPTSGAVASPYYHAAPRFSQDSQSVELAGSYVSTLARDAFSVTAKAADIAPASTAAAAPAAGIPDPGTAQAIALGIIESNGWGADQFNCLVSLWNRESHWNVYANNTGSGAYGIPQALPGSKMASAGADWQTNPATQITWGLGYIEGRYGSPCGAWAHSQDQGWY